MHAHVLTCVCAYMFACTVEQVDKCTCVLAYMSVHVVCAATSRKQVVAAAPFGSVELLPIIWLCTYGL